MAVVGIAAELVYGMCCSVGPEVESGGAVGIAPDEQGPAVARE